MINKIETIKMLAENYSKKTLIMGGIKTVTRTIETAEDLKNIISDFGGSGWLLTTGNKLMDISNGLSKTDSIGFIIRGELFDGTKTLQINRTSRVWTVAEKTFDETAEKLVEETEFRRHGYDQNVCYQVEYDVVPMMNHSEIQPVNYRFCGWDGRLS
jgi:hypothetical protein